MTAYEFSSMMSTLFQHLKEQFQQKGDAIFLDVFDHLTTLDLARHVDHQKWFFQRAHQHDHVKDIVNILVNAFIVDSFLENENVFKVGVGGKIALRLYEPNRQGSEQQNYKTEFYSKEIFLEKQQVIEQLGKDVPYLTMVVELWEKVKPEWSSIADKRVYLLFEQFQAGADDILAPKTSLLGKLQHYYPQEFQAIESFLLKQAISEHLKEEMDCVAAPKRRVL